MLQGDIVYLDVIFLINLIMDYVILWAAGKFAENKSSITRLAVGALTGAIWSLVIFYLLYFGPDYISSLKLLFVKLIASVTMVVISFPNKNLKKFFHTLVYMYLVAFAMGGAMLGSIYLFQNNPSAYTTMNGLMLFLINVRYTWLITAVAIAIMAAIWGRKFIKRNIMRSMLQVPVVIKFGEQRLAVKALVDTGNNLRDPLTNKPVMIAEYNALHMLFPEKFRVLYEKDSSNIEAIIKCMENEPEWSFRVRLIPFSSIGKTNGMLLGLRPDNVVIVTDDRTVKVKEVIIALYDQRLSAKGEYRALLHPDILDAA